MKQPVLLDSTATHETIEISKLCEVKAPRWPQGNHRNLVDQETRNTKQKNINNYQRPLGDKRELVSIL